MIEDINNESEKKELNTLIEKGCQFEVEDVQMIRKKGIWGFFKKREKVKIKHSFVIEEPTLRTLDLISAEAIQMIIDENVMVSSNSISEAKKLSKEHSRRCAKVIALAVLGRDYILSIPQRNGLIQTRFDDKSLNELTELFFRCVKPSKLLQLTLLVNTMMNLGDFTNSIRLMSGARTTMPNRIEEKQQD